MTNAVSFLQKMIRCPSITPKDEGVMAVVEKELEKSGFTCERLVFGSGEEQVQNLYAKKGRGEPHFCFAGHVDVVPVEGQDWTYPPFGAEIHDGRLYGRGAMDMKSGIACFVKALEGFEFKGTVSLMITGDEEGIATYGTPAMLKELSERGEKWTVCLVGEPSGTGFASEYIKTGRRGSYNATLTVYGKGGHTGYPHQAVNALEVLTDMLAQARKPLDEGTQNFQPSTLALTTIDVGNTATNVIPAEAKAKFNIRFNDCHTADSLDKLMVERMAPVAEKAGATFIFESECSGNAFMIPDCRFREEVKEAVEEITGRKPEESTGGGTSDARFIIKHCPVLECGINGQNMHGPNESVAVEDIALQAKIYRRILEKFFAGYA